MKIVLLGLLLVFGEMKAKSQDLSGEWKGWYHEQTINGTEKIKMYLTLFRLTDSTFKGFSYTLLPENKKDTILCEISGTIRAKNKVILNEVFSLNKNMKDSCMLQKMVLNLQIGRKMILKGVWGLSKECFGDGGAVMFKKND